MRDKSPLLTAIVPISNMANRMNNLETWVSEQVETDLQIVLVHDFRDCETGEQILDLIKNSKNMNIDFAEGQYGSPGEARNVGLTMAKSAWICFWDSDDLPNVDEFLEMVRNAEMNGRDIAIGEFEVASDLTREILGRSHSLKNQTSNLGLNPGIWRMAFKRNKIKLPNFSNLKLAEDQIFLAEVFSNSRNCAFTEKIVYRYFIGSQYHLTSDSRNLVDLNRALGILDGLEINEMNKDLIGLMTFKNSLTLISKGSLKLKYRGLLSLFYTILIRRNPYQTIKLAAKVIFTKGLYN